jgi:eukaryotic translation initiation factor 2C
MGQYPPGLPIVKRTNNPRRKFAVNNKDRPIKAWGVCAITGHRGSIPPPAVQAFFQKFVQIYESHGGLVMAHPQHGKTPWMGPGNLADGGMYPSQPASTLLILRKTLR